MVHVCPVPGACKLSRILFGGGHNKDTQTKMKIASKTIRSYQKREGKKKKYAKRKSIERAWNTVTSSLAYFISVYDEWNCFEQQPRSVIVFMQNGSKTILKCAFSVLTCDSVFKQRRKNIFFAYFFSRLSNLSIEKEKKLSFHFSPFGFQVILQNEIESYLIFV